MDEVPALLQETYDALRGYTLTLADVAFVHQHVVDAWAAQIEEPGAKPIRLAFALAGLHLHLDRGWDGRRVQRAHIHLANGPREWPDFQRSLETGALSAVDVMTHASGPARIRAIDDWCRSVWHAYADQHAAVSRWLDQRAIERMR